MNLYFIQTATKFSKMSEGKTVKKLNPHVQDALRARKVLAASTISVSFASTTTVAPTKPSYTTAIYVGSTPTGKITQKITQSVKTTPKKTSVSTNNGSTRPTNNGSATNSAKAKDIGGKSNGVVAKDTNGIQLMGYKMTNGEPNGHSVVDSTTKSKTWTGNNNKNIHALAFTN